jgi:hypothetical protein
LATLTAFQNWLHRAEQYTGGCLRTANEVLDYVDRFGDFIAIDEHRRLRSLARRLIDESTRVRTLTGQVAQHLEELLRLWRDIQPLLSVPTPLLSVPTPPLSVPTPARSVPPVSVPIPGASADHLAMSTRLSWGLDAPL